MVTTVTTAATVAMFTRLMTLNQEAFDKGWFDVAYHALAGALHAAEQEPNAEALSQLSQVETTATKQAAWIDKHAPDYRHSTVSTQHRSQSNESKTIYTMLAHQAHARQAVVKSRAL